MRNRQKKQKKLVIPKIVRPSPTSKINIKLTFEEPAETAQIAVDTKNPDLGRVRSEGPARGAVVGKFYMMDKLADPLILGFPEMASLGCYVEPPGDDGRQWVQFTSLGIRLPIIDEKRLSTKTVKVDGATNVEGLALHAVKVVMTRAEYLDHIS